MVFAVQAVMAFRNAARRNAVSSNIQTRLAQDVPFGQVVRTDFTNEAGDASVVLEVRFSTRAEQESFWADLQAAVGTGVNGPVVGFGFRQIHDCPHDQPSPAPCVVATRVDF